MDLKDVKNATVSQLKADIDGGRTGDKRRGFDPAAAPLGTDDEAAGSPPPGAAIDHARASEARPRLADATGAHDSLAPDAAPDEPAPDRVVPHAAPWLLLGGLISVVLVALLWLLLR
ncbi:MAG: hypothetical protein U1E23_06840 [Reyranellaceae bacterium]